MLTSVNLSILVTQYPGGEIQQFWVMTITYADACHKARKKHPAQQGFKMNNTQLLYDKVSTTTPPPAKKNAHKTPPSRGFKNEQKKRKKSLLYNKVSTRTPPKQKTKRPNKKPPARGFHNETGSNTVVTKHLLVCPHYSTAVPPPARGTRLDTESGLSCTSSTAQGSFTSAMNGSLLA